MIWVTADTHFNHTNICGPMLSKWSKGYRNFSTLDAMNNVLLFNINKYVMSDDILIHLGDFAFGNKHEIPALRNKINCKNIILILGNHDRCISRYSFEYLFTDIYTGNYIQRVHNTLVHMNHFPLAVWNENGRGSVHLYGHCHGSFQGQGRCMDVGVDCLDFQPIKLEDAVAQCLAKDIYAPDHHNAETNYG